MRKLKFVPLEERIVLDAAVANAVSEGATAAAAPPPTHILVIPTSVPDASHLADAAGADTAVILYDPSSTSLAQLADAIAQAAQGGMVEKIGFVAEGKAGSFNLTNSDAVNSSTLNGANTNLLGFWHSVANSLLPGGGIDILACDVAASNAGQQMLSQLASIINDQGTHFTLNASADVTGSTAQGGNWFMEYGNDGSSHNAGAIYFDSTSLQAWNHTLATSGLLINSPDFLVTHESGTTDSFQVSLLSAPTSTVLVTINTNISQIGLSTSTLTFNAGNWNVAQTVTVSAVDNLVLNDTNPYNITFSLSSVDADFNNAPVQSLTAYHIDNDAAGIFISPPSGLITTEDGGTASFRVYLQKPVTAGDTVSIQTTSADTTEGNLLGSSLVVMNPANSATGVLLTVGGVNDGINDGPQAYNILSTIVGSSDSNYVVGTAGPTVQLTNTNNDNGLAPFLKRVTYTLNGDITMIANGVLTSPTPPPGVNQSNNGTDMTYIDVDSNATTFNSSSSTLNLLAGSTVAWAGLYWGGLAAPGADAPPNPGALGTVKLAYGNGSYLNLNASTLYSQQFVDGAQEFSAFADVTSILQANGSGTYTVANIQASDGAIVGTSWEGGRGGWTIMVIYQNGSVAQHNVTVFDGLISVAGDAVNGGGGPGALPNYEVNVSGFVTPTAGNVQTTLGVVAWDGEFQNTSTVGMDDIYVNGIAINNSANPLGNVMNGSISIFGDDAKPDRDPNYINNLGYDSDLFALNNVLGNGQTSTTVNFSIHDTPTLNAAGDRFLVSVLAFSTVTPGIDVDPSANTVTEAAGAGHTSTVSIKLSSQPTANVTIPVFSSDTTEGTVSVSSVTFTSANWDTAQIITVTGFNDAIDDGNKNFTINFGAATSTDASYNGFVANPIQMVNIDNDTAGINVSPVSGLVTTESGGQATFTVVLTSQPTANVSIDINSADSTEGTASTSFLTFTAANWNVAQTVTITGVDDALFDGPIDYTINVFAATSSDLNYNGLDPSNVTVTNLDNEPGAILITPTTGLTTTELGGKTTFSVVLNKPPSANVSIGIASSDTTEGVVSTSNLIFTNANWNVAQLVTVEGVFDLVNDGDVAYSIITGIAVSADATFNGVNPTNVSITNLDTADVVVNAADFLVTHEDGLTDSFQVLLSAPPTSTVTITLNTNLSQIGLSTRTLTFDASNWNVAQTVTVSAVDNSVLNDTAAYIINFGVSSLDPNFNNEPVESLTVYHIDNDAVGVFVSPASGLTTTEDGGTATFKVYAQKALTGTQTVTVGLTSSDTDEGLPTTSSVVLNASNSTTGASVTVTGVDDGVIDGPTAYSIITSITGVVGASGYTTAVAVPDVQLTNLNDDTGLSNFVRRISYTLNGDITIMANGMLTSPTPPPGPTDGNNTTDMTYIDVDSNATTFNSSSSTLDLANGSTVAWAGLYWSGLMSTAAGETPPNSNQYHQIKLGYGSGSYTDLTADTIYAQTYDDGAIEYSAFADVTTFVQTNGEGVYTVANLQASDGMINGASWGGARAGWTILVIYQNGSTAQHNVTVFDGLISIAGDASVGGGGPGSLESYTVPVSGFVTPTTGDVHTNVAVILHDGEPVANPGTADQMLVNGVAIGNAANPANNIANGTISIYGDDAKPDRNPNYANNLSYDSDLFALTNVLDNNQTSVDVNFSVNTAPQPGDRFLVSMMAFSTVTPGIDISPNSTTTTEAPGAGHTATFEIKLSSAPTANVTIPVFTSDATEGTVSVSSITFTSANWDTPQTVTITGVDEFIDDGNQNYNIVFGAATSADAAYDGFIANPIQMVNVDNDTAGITVIPTTGLETTEAGGQATFIVRLNSQPTANVTIGLSSSDTTEGTISTSSLLFTAANWNVDQIVTITGVDDFGVDGDINYSIITAAATSGDVLYNGVNAANVSVTNLDNDVAGVLITPTSGLNTTEAGGQATFTVVLTSQPTANVTIGFSSSDLTEGTVSNSSLTFNAANWNIAQTITITGVDDFVDDGNINYTILTTATSTDVNYSGLNVVDVSVTNINDDTAGITVTPTSGLVTTEAGGQATFTVVLTSQPTANVTIGISSNDTTEGTVSAPSLTFTAANWNIAQTITVTGVDEFIDDGNIAYTLITAPATSADVNYSGLNAVNVTATNIDNDTFGITIIPLAGLTTTEAGGTATFIVRLNSQPLANVTIGLTSSDLTEGSLSAPNLTFTAANWNVDQIVTVTGVNDFVDDGNINYSIITGPATSSDVLYSGLNAPNVTATNVDNDVTGFIRVGPINTVFEEGNPTAGTVAITLTSEPIAPVTVYINNPGNGAFIFGPSSVVFDATNWNAPHIITIGTYDDGIVNPAPLSYNLTFTTVTTDPTYSLVTPEAIQVTINNSTRSAAPPTNPPYSFDEPIGTGGDDDGTGGPGGNGNNPFGGDEPFGSHPFGNDDPFGNLTGGVSEFSFLSRNRLAGFGLSLNDNLSFSRNLSSSGLGRSGFERVIFENQFAHNDASSLLYADPSIIITEAPNHEDAQVFFVNLTNAPTDTVNLSVITSDPDNVNVSSNKELQFTPENWARPQEIRIDRSELTKHDFSTPLYIDISPAKSGDIDYNGMRPGRITIDRMNDEAPAQKAAWNAATKAAAMMIPDLGYAIMQPHYDAAVDPIEAMEAAAIAPQKVAFHQVIDEYNLISQ